MRSPTLSVLVLLCIGVFLATPANMADNFKLGAFNIQVFGKKKANNPDVMSVLSRILRRYDIVLIQEIREKSGQAIETLLAETNKYSGKKHKYEMVISDRLGRTSSKEQYAFFYRTAEGITVLDSYHYDDGDEATGEDIFQREPFIVRFHIPQLAVKEVALVAIHTDPGQAVAETKALSGVTDDVIKKWGIEDVIVLGDLNADCSSFPKKAWKNLSLKKKSKYFWPIGDSIDTTTGKTDCAYDRFVLTGPNLISSYVDRSAGVYRFDKTYKLDEQLVSAVSDHYPIELELKLASTRKSEPRGDSTRMSEPRLQDDDVTDNGCADRFISFCSCSCAALIARFVQSLNCRNNS